MKLMVSVCVDIPVADVEELLELAASTGAVVTKRELVDYDAIPSPKPKSKTGIVRNSITEAAIKEARRLNSSNPSMSQAEIGRRVGISGTSVSRILGGFYDD